jgi:hypothetical protein
MKAVWSVLLLLVLIVVGAFFFGSERGEAPTLIEEESMANNLTLASPSFGVGSEIPSRFTCDGENINPELTLSGVPEGSVSLALVMDDPDIPSQVKERLGKDEFVHWVLFNISPTIGNIPEGGAPGVEGNNGGGKLGYTGPCPPTEFDPTEHRYFFRVYALDTELNLSEGATKEDILSAMEGHVLDETELMGTFDRAK